MFVAMSRFVIANGLEEDVRQAFSRTDLTGWMRRRDSYVWMSSLPQKRRTSSG